MYHGSEEKKGSLGGRFSIFHEDLQQCIRFCLCLEKKNNDNACRPNYPLKNEELGLSHKKIKGK